MAKKFRLAITLPGLAVFLIALVILVRSLAARNAYEILLSSGALVFWILLGFAGAWGTRRLSALEPLWKPPIPLGAYSGPEGDFSGEDWLVSCPVLRFPWFFRLHFRVNGQNEQELTSGYRNLKIADIYNWCFSKSKGSSEEQVLLT